MAPEPRTYFGDRYQSPSPVPPVIDARAPSFSVASASVGLKLVQNHFVPMNRGKKCDEFIDYRVQRDRFVRLAIMDNCNAEWIVASSANAYTPGKAGTASAALATGRRRNPPSTRRMAPSRTAEMLHLFCGERWVFSCRV